MAHLMLRVVFPEKIEKKGVCRLTRRMPAIHQDRGALCRSCNTTRLADDVEVVQLIECSAHIGQHEQHDTGRRIPHGHK